ncbi:mucin-2 isoform X10 [Drosophila montana]|uniref:mucin-2 isoform X10 n=1 Tax=Drosophila montana TaxID=40370 RepID=UPI00313A7D06
MSTTPEETAASTTEMSNDSNTSSEVMEPDSANSTQLGSGEATNNSNNSNNSQEQYDEAVPLVSQLQKYSSKISQSEIGFPNTDADYSELVEDNNDTATGESKRRARQLRPYPHPIAKWPAHNYRSVDTPVQQPYIQKNSYSFGSYNPYLTPPSQQTHTNQNYNKPNPGPGYKAYPQQLQQPEPAEPYGKKPTLVYTGYNLSLPPPPLEDDFRPIAGNYYGAASSTSSRPPGGYQEQTSQADLLPYLIQQLKEIKERRKQIQTENFAYFHLDNQPIAPTAHSTTPRPSFEYFSTTKSTPQVTPNSPYAQYSTMGGFYNNKPDYVPSTSNYSGKLISQYSITQSPEPQSTTESNYFQYNIIANQKMKGVYNTAKLNQLEHAAVKVRPPVTPLQVTPNFNIVSAPNLAYNKPNVLQQIPFRDLSHLPIGISYASNTSIPESYQTFTKSISSTVPPKPPTTTKPQMTNFQFNINEFMANLKASDLASFNPAVNPLIKYFKQVSNDGSGNVRNALILRRPVSSSTPTSTITTRPPFKSNPTPAKASISSTTQASTTPILKGYKIFVKNTQNQINKQMSEPNQSTTTSTPRPRSSGSRTTTTQKTVEYYDEDYDDGVDEDMLPPSRMPPYMPMSETMAPPRPQVTTNVPPTTTPSKIRPNVQTGFMEATTTRRPFPNFSQLNQPNTGNGVPAFISFPSDIFQELKQRLPQLQGSTAANTQSTLRVRVTSTTSTTTPTTPTRIRYTVRPPQRMRGQQKWQAQAVNSTDGLERTQNETGRGAAYAKPSSSNGGLGGQHLNSIHISSNTERQRNNNRNRGSAIYTNQDRDTAAAPNRGTHPPRTRPTLKPAGTIVSKAQEFVDIYRYPPTRPDPVYPQPTPDKTAAKCRKDVCLLPDCYCGGRDIPGGLNVSDIPQIVLITFDDAISTINIDLYDELFNNKSHKNPNGCPWRATFYLSHEWTDYGMVQDLYSDGHEMASHTVSHSFGEQFSQKKWTREIAGQREILAAYGGVKLSDVRGMRAPFLSVGGNKMYKMLYDSNFTYDSSMPVYENRPPSWPYTLDYKIFHDCMIPPCPTRSYPGVWQVPMVMWQDLNGGRCSMGDACSNPSDAEGVTKMIMKNFERHYTTNRAPFGLFYHAAWFTQPHHKEGFIKFLDAINAMQDVWIITNWQALQWVRDPTPTSRINSFQPFQCDYSDRPKRCNNPKVCNLWHKSGVRYMKTCQPCPDIYPWTGKSGIRSSRIDNEVVEEPSAQN